MWPLIANLIATAKTCRSYNPSLFIFCSAFLASSIRIGLYIQILCVGILYPDTRRPFLHNLNVNPSNIMLTICTRYHTSPESILAAQPDMWPVGSKFGSIYESNDPYQNLRLFWPGGPAEVYPTSWHTPPLKWAPHRQWYHSLHYVPRSYHAPGTT